MEELFKNKSQKICDILELLVACIIGIAVLGAIISYVPTLLEHLHGGLTPDEFLHLLEEVFGIVIGIEFLKMLCKPEFENVIEVLIFLIGRHMIVGHNTAIDNVLSVVAVSILFLVDYHIHKRNDKGNDKENM